MNFPYFTGDREKPAMDGYTWLPPSRTSEQTLPENYDTEKGLVDAVNVALLMGQPLLLTGEPGTGKTQLAFRVAWELGFGKPLKFETKSDSKASHLFYRYNSLARFHDAQVGDKNKSGVDYITYNALGLAMIRSKGIEEFEYPHLLSEDFEWGVCRRSVVLIDEIDKAPRDFPNDILNEIENFYFHIHEFGNTKIEADLDMKPVIFITSNLEKHLPDPFLRRCVFYHIDFPDKERMRTIVDKRLRDLTVGSDSFLKDAIALFYKLREENVGIKKKPATAELLVWLVALREMSETQNPIIEDPDVVINSLGALIKSEDDMLTAKGTAAEWMNERPK